MTTALLLFIGALGVAGGLSAVERVESLAVGLKLAIIGGLCAALGAGLFVVPQSELSWPDAVPLNGNNVAVLLGLLIVAQGFETSRYLGSEFGAAVSIKTMRSAQLISAAIYLVFFALITPFLTMSGAGDGVTALVDVADEN